MAELVIGNLTTFVIFVTPDSLMSSSSAPILLRGGTVVNADSQQKADVLIQGEKIVAVGPNLAAPPNAVVHDVAGKLVIPGINVFLKLRDEGHG